MTTERVAASHAEPGFPGIGLGFFMRRRRQGARKVGVLVAVSAALLIAGAALLWFG
ncbi:MAG: hypothetical protein KDJ14_06005 [Xanthomonadales bacterium]|nr:hypothetical protein [Xanthomonadales bacterium]